MDSPPATALVPYVIGLALIGVAVAGVVPGALAATLGVLGVALMTAYAYRFVRSGALGHGRPAGGDGYLGDGDGAPAGHHGHHHGGHGHGDGGGWFGGGDFGGGGHGGGGHGGH
jgi:hypothetical protein